MGLDLKEKGTFLATMIDKIYMYDSKSFQQVGEIPIKLLPTETREPN